LELPYYDNATLSAAHRIHEYKDGKSYFYYTDVNTGDMATYRYNTYQRTEAAYRFIGYSSDEILSYTDLPTGGGTILVGNPFVGAIDFTEFCEDNTNVLEITSYRLWDGDKFITVKKGDNSDDDYTILDKDDKDLSYQNAIDYRYIAPLQSFLLDVKKAADRGGTTGLKFDVTKTAGSSISKLRSATLRSSAVETNTLRLSARNVYFSSETLIAKRKQAADAYRPEEDVYKLFSQKTYVPEVYTVVDHYALAMNFIEGEKEILIPVGLKTTFKGSTTFTLTGMDRYNAESIEFIDLGANLAADITNEESYEYQFNNQANDILEGRFFIRILPTKGSGIDTEKAVHNNVYAFRQDDEIKVIASPENLIRQVAVYNLQGHELYRQVGIDADRCTIHGIHGVTNEALIVRIITEYGIKNVKLVK
ncbi:MAG: hypothetical protein LBC40_08295, partial [Dysgonamonadaceae bacterium]|nr:hypothetical protein [Dysgonamonadaceae bacterium]